MCDRLTLNNALQASVLADQAAWLHPSPAPGLQVREIDTDPPSACQGMCHAASSGGGGGGGGSARRPPPAARSELGCSTRWGEIQTHPQAQRPASRAGRNTAAERLALAGCHHAKNTVVVATILNRSTEAVTSVLDLVLGAVAAWRAASPFTQHSVHNGTLTVTPSCMWPHLMRHRACCRRFGQLASRRTCLRLQSR